MESHQISGEKVFRSSQPRTHLYHFSNSHLCLWAHVSEISMGAVKTVQIRKLNPYGLLIKTATKNWALHYKFVFRLVFWHLVKLHCYLEQSGNKKAHSAIMTRVLCRTTRIVKNGSVVAAIWTSRRGANYPQSLSILRTACSPTRRPSKKILCPCKIFTVVRK